MNLDDGDNADWLKGAVRWPYPDDLESLRAFLAEQGWTVEAFKTTVLYKRWLARKPWLKDL